MIIDEEEDECKIKNETPSLYNSKNNNNGPNSIQFLQERNKNKRIIAKQKGPSLENQSTNKNQYLIKKVR